MRKPLTLLILFLFCSQAVSRVRFILKAENNRDFCEKGTVDFTLTVVNESEQSVWVLKDILNSMNPPNHLFYLMVKKEGEKEFKKISYENFHAIWRKSFFELPPEGKLEVNYSFPSSVFSYKYLAKDFCFKALRFIFTHPFNFDWRDNFPVLPGKYECYFVYELKVDPKKYGLQKNALIGRYVSNRVFFEIPRCSFKQKLGFLFDSLKMNKYQVAVWFFIYGLLFLIVFTAVFLFQVLYKIVKKLFIKLRDWKWI